MRVRTLTVRQSEILRVLLGATAPITSGTLALCYRISKRVLRRETKAIKRRYPNLNYNTKGYFLDRDCENLFKKAQAERKQARSLLKSAADKERFAREQTSRSMEVSHV